MGGRGPEGASAGNTGDRARVEREIAGERKGKWGSPDGLAHRVNMSAIFSLIVSLP